MSNEYKLTSVKLVTGIYDDFRRSTVGTKINLQKLINRSLYMYLTDESFKQQIETATEIEEKSGSKW